MWKRLLPYLEKDLRQISDAELDRLFAFLETHFPRYCESIKTLEPYYLWEILNSNTPSKYVMVGGKELEIVPGSSRAFISVFDESDGRVNTSAFSSGWRINIKDMEFIKVSTIGVPLVVVSSCPLVNGRDIALQYYALCNNQAVLVRLERSDGIIMPNVYIPINQMIGPPVPKKSVDEWEASLNSNDKVEILIALMWISGIHRDRPTLHTGDAGSHHERNEYLEQIRYMFSRVSVRETLIFLGRDDHPWIRQAARLAVDSMI